MLLEQVNTLSRYWANHPPVHELLALQMGISPAEAAPVRPEITDADRRKLDALTRKWGLA